MSEVGATGSVAPPPSGASQDSSTAGRSILVVALLVVAALLTTPAITAYWGQRTLNDTGRYIDTVGPLVKQPEVQQAISTKVTDAIQQQVDVEAVLNQAFAGVIDDRPRLQLLVGPISGAIDGLIENQVNNFIASDAFEDLWVAANTRSQQALVRVLNGEETGAVTLQNDQIVLDVSQVIDEVKARLVDRGLTFLDRVPTVAEDREIVLLDAPALKQAQTVYALGNPVAKWLIWVVLGLFVAAVVASRRRSRTTVWVGVIMGANALLISLVLSVGQQFFVNQLAGTVFGPASRVFYQVLLSYLERAGHSLLVLGLILILVGWFTGRNGPGTAARTTSTRLLESAGAPLAGTSVAGAGRWIQGNASWLRIVVALLGVVVLVWGNNIEEARVLWSFVLVVVLLAVIQVLVGVGKAASRVGPVPPSNDTQELPLGAAGS